MNNTHARATNDVKLLNHESIHRYVSTLPVIIVYNRLILQIMLRERLTTIS